MSPEAVTADLVYRELRERLASGDFAPRASLVAPQIAGVFGTSISPVRDALHRLVGEMLVEPQPGGGFAVPAMSNSRAENLYRWSAEIIGLVLDCRPDLCRLERPEQQREVTVTSQNALASATSRFFSDIVACSPNSEHVRAYASADARIGPLRLHESVLPGRDEELQYLWETAVSGNARATRAAIRRYHRRRIARVDMIISGLLRSGAM